MTTILHASTLRHKEWGGPKRFVRIVLYDTNAEFLKAFQRGNPGDPGRTIGSFSSVVQHFKYDKKTKDWIDKTHPHFAGTIRISREHCTYEVLSHEVVHAACCIYRLDIKEDIDLGDGCGVFEEKLAYIIGDLTNAVMDVLVGRGCFHAT